MLPLVGHLGTLGAASGAPWGALGALGALGAAAYLLGSIPFGFLLGRRCGIDLRRVGSGNIGATNLKRALPPEKRPALMYAFCLLLDGLKGFVPAFFLAPAVIGANGWFSQSREWSENLARAVAGVGAILGHNFTVFLRFRGGKGVATTIGAGLAADPVATLLALLVWRIARSIWGYISVASMAFGAALPVLFATYQATLGRKRLFADDLPLLVFLVFAALMIVLRHRSNIARLLAGTEPKSGENVAATIICSQKRAPPGKRPAEESRGIAHEPEQ